MTSKIFLIFHGRFPSEKAAGIFTAKNAESFSGLGLEAVVVVPRRLGRAKASPKHYYGLIHDFRTVYLPIIDLFKLPILKRVAFLVSYISFSLSSFFYLLFVAKRGDILYSNEALPVFLLSLIFPKVFYEVHDFPKINFLNKTLFKHAQGIIVTNRWKQEKLAEAFQIPGEKVLYHPNAVDIAAFEKATNDDIRTRYGISKERVIGYVGSLRTMEMEKGLEVLLRALREVSGTKLLVVGGSNEDIDFYKDIAKGLGIESRVIFTGWIPHVQVPAYLKACDVLVAPFPNTDHYNFYMSPMKIFEYMAAGKPIVATRLNSIQEILDDDSAFLVAPDSSRALVEGLRSALEGDAQKKAEVAKERAFQYGWLERAEDIVRFVNTR